MFVTQAQCSLHKSVGAWANKIAPEFEFHLLQYSIQWNAVSFLLKLQSETPYVQYAARKA